MSSYDEGWVGEGAKEMEELYKLARSKNCYLGALIKPKRGADELRDDPTPANLVIVISSSRAIMSDTMVMSDEVTESLAVTAKFLAEEMKNYR